MIVLNVNGTEQRMDVSPDTPLLWVQREKLGLSGSKFGCSAGLCGAGTRCSSPVQSLMNRQAI
jgi:isoquinoline 1-oxidoreductase alpha subunit